VVLVVEHGGVSGYMAVIMMTMVIVLVVWWLWQW
jgi:hypothetical protein